MGPVARQEHEFRVHTGLVGAVEAVPEILRPEASFRGVAAQEVCDRITFAVAYPYGPGRIHERGVRRSAGALFAKLLGDAAHLD